MTRPEKKASPRIVADVVFNNGRCVTPRYFYREGDGESRRQAEGAAKKFVSDNIEAVRCWFIRDDPDSVSLGTVIARGNEE